MELERDGEQSGDHSLSQGEQSSGCEDFSGSDVGDGSTGFKAFDGDGQRRSQMAEVDNSPAAQSLRRRIRNLVSQYPELELRTTFQLQQQLRKYTTDQLEDIYQCATTQLLAIRGTPTSEAVINIVGYGVEQCTGVEGYTQRCQQDLDLNKEIENEMLDVMAYCGEGVRIVIRFANNYVKAKLGLPQNPNKPHESEENGMAKKRNIHSIWDNNEEPSRDDSDEDEKEGGERKGKKNTTKKRQKKNNASS